MPGVQHGDDRSDVLRRTCVVWPAGVIERDIGAAPGDRDRRVRRLVLDIVQMANRHMIQVDASRFEQLDLIERRLRDPAGGMRDDGQARPHVQPGDGVEHLPFLGIHRGRGAGPDFPQRTPSLRPRASMKVLGDLLLRLLRDLGRMIGPQT